MIGDIADSGHGRTDYTLAAALVWKSLFRFDRQSADMTEQEHQPSFSWAERGAYWAKTSPEGKSDMDAGNQAIAAAAEIRPGDNVLDICSGTGEPGISIALHVGPEGSVTAYDLNPEMLQGARDRAANLELANMNFEIGDMMALPFEDNSFDAVTCRFGIMFPDDGAPAVREAARVLKPGKRAVYMVHGPAGANDLYRVLRKTVFAYFGEEEPPGPNRRSRYSGEGELNALLTAAGLEDVAETPLAETQERPAGRFWQRLLERQYGQRLEDLSPDGLEELHRRIAGAFEPYRKGDHYEVLSTDRLGSGRKPA